MSILITLLQLIGLAVVILAVIAFASRQAMRKRDRSGTSDS